MAKKNIDPDIVALRDVMNRCDIDMVLYHLVQLAVEKRDSASDESKVNKAEVAYWQKVIVILNDTEEKLSSL